MRIVLVVLTVIILMSGFMVIKNMRTPADLGMKNGQFKPLSSKPNGVSSQAEDTTKFVKALSFIGDVETTKDHLLEACESFGKCTVMVNEEDYMHVVFTTGTMKYRDDVEFYFDKTNEIVHYRSESRIGYSDMGLNKERYEAIALNYNTFMKEAN